MNATTQCKNCGADITGRYCAACGQHADVSIPSLHRLFVEVLGDLYNFDSRLWRSLGLLLVKPGRLTREYVEGRRARYLPPFRLYVVLSLTFFFVLAVLPDLNDEGGTVVSDGSTENSAQPAIDDEGSGPVLENAAPANAPEEGPPGRSSTAAPERTRPRGFAVELTEDGDGKNDWNCDLGDAEDLNPEVRARFEQGCEKIEADAGSFGRALLEHVPVMMFFFIPIVAAGMKVIYPLARRKYVEHLMFFLHFHAFFFLLATLGLLVTFSGELFPALAIPVTLLAVAGWTYVPVYLFLAMRQVYAQGRLATTFKFVLLGGGYFFAMLVTFVGAVVYTALTL